jgi:molybdopterin converting factor small subunit
MSSAKLPAGHFNLLYFAAASTYTKKQSEHMSAPLPVKDLFSTLESLYPGIKEKVLNSCMLTINLEYVDFEETGASTIKEGDEVAIIPPVSSG